MAVDLFIPFYATNTPLAHGMEYPKAHSVMLHQISLPSDSSWWWRTKRVEHGRISSLSKRTWYILRFIRWSFSVDRLMRYLRLCEGERIIFHNGTDEQNGCLIISSIWNAFDRVNFWISFSPFYFRHCAYLFSVIRWIYHPIRNLAKGRKKVWYEPLLKFVIHSFGKLF